MSSERWLTVHTGSPWELDLFCGMLDDEGIPWRRPDDVIGGVDALVDPTSTIVKRLEVREQDADRAQELITSHRATVTETEDDEYELGDQEEVELIARHVRFASWTLVGLLIAPWLLALYRRACRERGTRSSRHALTVAAPWIAGGVILLVVLAFRYVPTWLPDRAPDGGVPRPPPMRQPILPG